MFDTKYYIQKRETFIFGDDREGLEFVSKPFYICNERCAKHGMR